MNTELKNVLDWYSENGVLDFVNETPVNHFELQKQQNTQKSSKPQQTKSNDSNNFANNPINIKSKNMDEIIKLLALKHNNRNTKNTTSENILTPAKAVEMARNACDKINTLEELKAEIEKFEGCYSIKKLATNTVFGEGNTKADILIIGEAPGNNEDLQGKPFCGQNGILLDNMFKAIGYKREDMYITNTLFWRPPGNRRPTPEELAMCKPFVEKHIALINPKVIVMMGATALRNLIETTEGITKARRKFFDYNNMYLDKSISATALFHPSYLLRRPIKKRDTWKDLLILKEFVNTKL